MAGFGLKPGGGAGRATCLGIFGESAHFCKARCTVFFGLLHGMQRQEGLQGCNSSWMILEMIVYELQQDGIRGFRVLGYDGQEIARGV